MPRWLDPRLWVYLCPRVVASLYGEVRTPVKFQERPFGKIKPAGLWRLLFVGSSSTRQAQAHQRGEARESNQQQARNRHLIWSRWR
jgi:hypothetical protein